MSASEAEVAAWLSARAERTIETAIGRVFLAGDTALKMKRRLDLSYVDFTTPERRLWALRRELEFNREAAPDIYRRVLAVTREAGGALALDGAGEVVDHVLEMRRFDEAGVLAARPEALDGEMAEALGRAIARFHGAAPVRPEGGVPALTIRTNIALLRDLKPRLGPQRVERMLALTEAELERQAPLMARRTAAGFIRRCHGDLHLGNILVENGRPVLFDCIEFNDELSDIDVQYDLAFLLMDLSFRARPEPAVRALSAYLDEAARVLPEGVWEGLVALPLMMSVRAAVRAHVAAWSGDDDLAGAYLDAAIAHLSPAPPVLAAVGGLSGSGKTTHARRIAPGLGAAPGAVILRTDEVRKRILGAGPLDPLGPEAYAADMDARTYAALFGTARTLLAAGRAVVLDATFRDPALRARAETLAAEAGVPFQGLWMDAPLAVLEARVAGRTGDASDATVEVLRAQAAALGEVRGWTRVVA